jgi:hypothetical protein
MVCLYCPPGDSRLAVTGPEGVQSRWDSTARVFKRYQIVHSLLDEQHMFSEIPNSAAACQFDLRDLVSVVLYCACMPVTLRTHTHNNYTEYVVTRDAPLLLSWRGLSAAAAVAVAVWVSGAIQAPQ